MLNAKPGRERPDDARPAGRIALAVALLLAAFFPRPSAAQDRPEPGLVVPIPTTITSESTNRLRTTLYHPLHRFEAERGQGPARASFRLVCDFNPEGRANSTDDFGACLTLANYLRELQRQGVQTVAFVHGEVSRHAVLAVLACGEIVMSADPEARLGKVAPSGKSLDKVAQVAYEDVPRNRYPLVLVRKMYDRDLVVLRAPPGHKGERFIATGPQAPAGSEAVPELGPGDTAAYNFRQARDFGLCQQTERNTIDDVLEAYHLDRSALSQPLDRRVAWRLVVSGTVNGELREKLQRRVRRALGAQASMLILQIGCGDGDSGIAHDLGMFLATLNDNRRDAPIETIAFVTRDARNTAAFLALGCNKIVLQREARPGEPSAHLGDFDTYLKDKPNLEGALREQIAEVARKQHYSPVLAEALVSRDLRVHQVVSIKGESARRFLTEDELKADQEGERRWRSLEVVWPRNDKDRGHTLSLSADRAHDLRFAAYTASGIDELYDREGLSAAEVHTAEADWLDDLADFLRDPWTSVILVMLGITCLILELKMPGVVMPGVISAVCFVLFFWSHSQLNGQITWLALLLFLLGLVLIALEVFVLPGFGVAGISGIILLIGSLGLVAYGHWPRTQTEWAAYGQHLGPFGLSILGALISAFLLARYLPSIPYVNRIILQPQDEAQEQADAVPDAQRSEMLGLLGAIGVAATTLRPAGKAQFGDAFVDVVADGGYVTPGTRVQVIEIEGNRVVVKEV